MKAHLLAAAPALTVVACSRTPTAKRALDDAKNVGNPVVKQLYDSITALKLDAKTKTSGHGGVAPFAELENAVKNVQ